MRSSRSCCTVRSRPDCCRLSTRRAAVVEHVCRRRVRENIVTEDGDLPEAGAAVQEDRVALRDLERALWQLPEDQRVALLLVGMEGMSYEEAARVLDVPIGTVRSRLSRGRKSLRLRLDGRGEGTARA